MPVHHAVPGYRFPLPDDRAVLDRMPGSTVPVIRQPWGADDAVPYWAAVRFSGNHLYDLDRDPAEAENLRGHPLERDYADWLRQALQAIEAPPDQFVRLGLA